MAVSISRRSFLAGGALCTAAGRATPVSPEFSDIEFSFLQVSDTHVSKRRLFSRRRGYDIPAEESIRRCREVVKQMNECSLPYELIVHTGDVAQTRDTDEDFDLARELLQFHRPDYYVPGNHDVGYSETGRYRPRFEKRFGVCNRSFEPVKGLRFALFDNQPLDPRCGDEDREKAFERLDRILTPRKPTILCCHLAGVPSFYLNRLFPGWPEKTMKRWTARLKEGGVVAVLAGHFHRDELHRVGGIPFYLAPPVINFWGRQTTYRHWTLSKGLLSYQTVYLDI